MAYLRKENINIDFIKSLTEKNQDFATAFLQNENQNSESNISLTNNEKISKPKISTENEHHRADWLLLSKRK